MDCSVSFELLEAFDGDAEISLASVSLNETDGSVREVMDLSEGLVISSGPAEMVLVGDFDGSMRVDFADLFLLGHAFRSGDPLFDLNRDGVVNFFDFQLFADSFGQTASN